MATLARRIDSLERALGENIRVIVQRVDTHGKATPETIISILPDQPPRSIRRGPQEAPAAFLKRAGCSGRPR